MAERKAKAGRASRASKAGRPAAKTRTAHKMSPTAKSSGQKSHGMGDWRGETLARMRALILEAEPEMIEERKWRKPSNNMEGVPVWSHHGIICTGETYKNVVKLTFAQGASLPDPARLFNSSLEGNTRRAIDIREGEKINAAAFKALVKAAVAHNGPPAKKAMSPPMPGGKAKPAAKTKPAAKSKLGAKAKPGGAGAKPVKLLSGGNPQIAKADGDAPVQAYIAAMPGWKGDLGRRLDALITRTVPNVRKAVRWNSPFYGIEGQGWFLGFHCITKYIKVAFFRGASLRPVPPGESKQKDVRYFHIYEDDQVDEKLLASWIRQAAELPGETMF